MVEIAAESQNALTSLSTGDWTATADSQKALTSLSTGDWTATADSQKALTSLAVPVADILVRLRSLG